MKGGPGYELVTLNDVMIFENSTASTEPGTPSEVFSKWWPQIGSGIGLALTIALAFILMREGWLTRRSDFQHLLWLSSLTLVVTQLIGIRTDPGNFIILFVPLVLVCAGLNQRWGRSGDWVVLIILLLFLIGLWVLFVTTLERGAQPIQNPILFFPLPVFLLAGLYFVRKQFVINDHQ